MKINANFSKIKEGKSLTNIMVKKVPCLRRTCIEPFLIHSDVTLDVYDHVGNRKDVREEVERYALAAGG